MLKKDIKAQRKEGIKIATELFYGEDVIEKIKKAKTKFEIEKILTTARKNLP